MLLRVLLMAVVALILSPILMTFLVDGILEKPFSEIIMLAFTGIFNIGEDNAINLYHYIFQNNKYLWMSIGFFLLLLVIFYIELSKFTRYFKQVEEGLDKLLEESDLPITLRPELEFMEKKLNVVKSTLVKRAKDAKEAEQRKNDLVVYLAHDIKTPLTSVVGYLSLLDEAPDMPAEQKAKYVGITLEKAYRLEELINEFFEITRFNLQTIQLDKSEINLSYMLLQMTDEFYPMLSPQGKKAVVHADKNITVIADADKLARVFNNILKNAVVYSYDNTAIEVKAERRQGKVIIAFENQGKTIPKQKLDTIFEKFFRMDYARSSHTGGAGLGLAIAKEIVRVHGGEIYAESENEKTKFTVVLPG